MTNLLSELHKSNEDLIFLITHFNRAIAFEILQWFCLLMNYIFSILSTFLPIKKDKSSCSPLARVGPIYYF